MRERLTKIFLEEKISKVGKALKQLKKDQRILCFQKTGPFSFKKRGVDFYVVRIDGSKYIARSLSVDRTSEKGQNKNSIRVSLFDSQNSIQRKILEVIKRF